MYWTNPGHEFDSLYEKMTSKDTTYRLWGAAELGTQFVERFANQFRIVQIVDKDPEKCGMKLGNIIVQQPEELVFDETSIVVVTCSFYEENKPCIEELGYQPYVNLFYYEEFYLVYNTYHDNYLRSYRLDVSLTEKCTLRCKKCNMFMPYFQNPRNQPLQDVLEDFDAYFSVVDEVRELDLLGGEPFLYPQFKQVVDYLGANYRERIEHLVVFTNATVVPSDEICESLQKYGVEVMISDYTNVIPYREKLEKFKKELDDYNVFNFAKDYETWADFGFPENCNDLPEDKLVDFFDSCRPPFRGLWKKRVYFCHLETSAIRAGIFEDNTNDFFDLTETNSDRKKRFMEFDYGYCRDGFVSFCRKCRGCDCVNSLTVPVAQQIKRD